MTKLIYSKYLIRRVEKKEMKIRFNLMFGILALLLIAGVYADTNVVQTLGTFKIGECITLRQICSTCSQNTIISISNPNSTTVLGTTAMVPNGNEYIFSYIIIISNNHSTFTSCY